jgi:hypothetical protein
VRHQNAQLAPPSGWRCGPSQANASAGRAWTRSTSAGAIR